VRLDPKSGSKVKQDVAFEADSRAKAAALATGEWGRQSLSGHERDRFFLSHQGRQFSDVSLLSGADHKSDGRAAALLDFDRDGRLDIAVANTNSPTLLLWHNDIPTAGNLIALRLTGGPKSNRDAIGTQVTVVTNARSQIRELHAGEGLAAQNSKSMLFSLGQAKTATIHLRWPSGSVQTIEDAKAGNCLLITEGQGTNTEPWPMRSQAGRGRN
jgi:enediyne biosynthesis protein E4